MIWKELEISSWREFINEIERLKSKSLIFRGQACTEWLIRSSFIRESKKFITSSRVLSENSLMNLEDKMIKLFQSQSHLYTQNAINIDKNNKLYFLSILQHFGAPTRLLDWTWSPYIAAAFCTCDNFDKDGAIYVINFEYFRNQNLRLIDEYKNETGKKLETRTNQSNIVLEFGKHYADLKERSGKDEPNIEKKILVAYEPEKKNIRLARQQGLFLVSSKINASMDDVIGGYGISDGSVDGNIVAIKIIVKKEIKVEFLKQLQLMNITNEILFPDMEGFCKSLKFKLLMEDKNIFI